MTAMQASAVYDLTTSEEYSAVVSSTFAPLTVRPIHDETRFRARFRRTVLPAITVAHMRCTPNLVRHSAHEPGSADERLIKVMLQLEGESVLTQDDEQARVRPGHMIAYDTARPYDLAFPDDHRVVVLGVPYSSWGSRAAMLSHRTRRTVGLADGVGQLVSTILSAADTPEDGQLRAGQSLFADALVSLVAAAFVGDASPPDAPGAEFHARVRAYCEANLADPGLSQASVAAAMGVSVSYLQKQVRSSGAPLGTWIRERRVERIVEDLRDPALRTLTITAIAHRWGVQDAGHLSRLVRGVLGCTAEDVRRQFATD